MPPDFRTSTLCTSRRSRGSVWARILLFPLACLLALFLYSSFDFHQFSTFTQIPLESNSTTSAQLSTGLSSASGSQILLVSAFYPLAKSKHTLREYKRWLSLFLGRITTDIYFFTPPDWEPLIREIRGDLPIVVNSSFVSPFDVPPLMGRKEQYDRMYKQDREARIHSPDLYAVWATKSYFLREGLINMRIHTQIQERTESMAGKEYQYAFWADAGTFRKTHVWKEWPDPARVDEVWEEGVRESGKKPEDLIFFPIEGLPPQSMKDWRESMGPIDSEISEGSFFGGMPSAIYWWYGLYFSYHDHWLDEGLFVGKDQTVFNALFMLYPSRFITVWLLDPVAPATVSLLSSYASVSSHDVHYSPPKIQLETPLGHCLNYWYYYVFFLGSELERAKMADVWLRGGRWGMKKEPCRVTNVLTMEGALRRAFGEEWVPPMASLKIAHAK